MSKFTLTHQINMKQREIYKKKKKKKSASVKTLIPGCHVRGGGKHHTHTLGLLYSMLIGQTHQQNPVFIMKGVCVLHDYSTIVLQKSIHRRGYLVSE